MASGSMSHATKSVAISSSLGMPREKIGKPLITPTITPPRPPNDKDGSGSAASAICSMTSLCYILLVLILSEVTVDGFAPCQISPKLCTTSLQSQESDGSEEMMQDVQNGSEEIILDLNICGSPSLTRNESSSTSSQLATFARGLRRLSILRPAVPNADFSAPLIMASAGGSSYTRLWNPETWKRHTLSHPHVRYFRHSWRWRYSTTAHKVLPATLLTATWALLVSCIVRVSPASILVKVANGCSVALSALTAPLALLLTLRTNAALGRLNETRLAWGRLVLYARSNASLLRTYALPLFPEDAILAANHVAIFGWLLKSQLRGEDRNKELEVMKAVLGSDSADYKWLASHPRPVWAITVRLCQIVAAVADKYPGQYIVAYNLLEEGIANFEGVVEVNERILASPIPPTYSRHLSRILTTWLAALPIALVGCGVPVLGVVISSALLSYVMIGLDEIGMEIEHPFSLLPLQQLAGAAQNGVGMQFIDNECSDGSFPDEIVSKMPPVPV